MLDSGPRLTMALLASLLIVTGPLALGLRLLVAEEAAIPSGKDLDPAAWGSDHVGRPLPQFVTGDECLFCHRDIGPSWAENRHNLTVRPATPDSAALQSLAGAPGFADVADEVDLLLGSERGTRFLQRGNAYGKLEMLNAAFVPDASGGGHLVDVAKPQWDADKFADRCGGCHATAVDSKTKAFAAVSLDCVTCHGNVPLGHSNDVSLVHLSVANRAPREVVSICGQCHLRGGMSKTTGLPYPNQFVAGDNLFRDFQVDWDDAAIDRMSPGDRHLFHNARDVALRGQQDVTCLSCHDVHGQSTEKHQLLTRTVICGDCHVDSRASPFVRSSEEHSAVCGY